MQNRKKAEANRWLGRGQASDYIDSIETLNHSDKVVLCCRVSGRFQDWKGNLDDSESHLRQVAESRELIIVDVVRYVGPGFEPIWLAKAAHIANEHGAALLAESTDRFIRHPAYDSKKNLNAQARDPDLQDLQHWTQGVRLVTVVHPDAWPEEVRGHQSKRGQRSKGNTGGRPSNKRRGEKTHFRLLNTTKVRWLHAVGFSLAEITKALGMRSTQKSTVQHWIDKLK